MTDAASFVDGPPNLRRALTTLSADVPTELGSFTGTASYVGALGYEDRRIRIGDATSIVTAGLARFTLGGVVLTEEGVAARRMIGPVERRAIISMDGCYRYVLEREWDPAGHSVCWVMLNPSKADADVDDPTIRRCLDFTRRWAVADSVAGIGRMTVVNLFARRATSPEWLRRLSLDEMTGPENEVHLHEQIARSAFLVAGWGGFYRHLAGRPLVEEFARTAGVPMYCLGTTAKGDPRHPLYVPKNTEREVWP